MAVVREQLPNGSGVFGYAIRPDVWSIGSTIGLESWFREDRIDVVHAAAGALWRSRQWSPPRDVPFRYSDRFP